MKMTILCINIMKMTIVHSINYNSKRICKKVMLVMIILKSINNINNHKHYKKNLIPTLVTLKLIEILLNKNLNS